MAENRCNEMSSSSSNSSSPMIADSNRSQNELKSNNKSSLNAPKYGTPVPNRVFVGGIPSDANETEVRQLFAQYGNVVSVKIINDRAGIPRGYGFVTFESEEDAKKVIKENDNLVIKSRKLNVSVAVKKQQHYSYELNPRLIASSGALMYNPFTINATNSFYPDVSLYTAEGIPLYQLGVSPQLMSNNGSNCNAYPYTYQSSGLYLTSQPSMQSLPPQFQTSSPSSYPYGCGTIRLPLTSQNTIQPNMNLNHQYYQLSNGTSPPLSQSSVQQIPTSMPLQVGTAANHNTINTDCVHSITGAVNPSISPLNLISSPVYAISSNIPLSNSSHMACVQNVQLKADNVELCSDNNSLMSANAMSPQMLEIVWPQRVPNIQCPNKSAAINRIHYSSKPHNNVNTTNDLAVNKERRNNSSFNTSQQRKLGNNNGNNRSKAISYGSQNRYSYVSATDNESQSANNHESYQSSTPNSAAFQGQPFVKQYSQKLHALPINQSVVNNSHQPLGPKHTITGQTYIPKVVNGVQIYALANLSGGDIDSYGYSSGSPLTPPLTPGNHQNVLKNINQV